MIWRCSKVSNSWISKYLLKQKQFPPQIAVAVQKTYNNGKKFLRKHVYCSGFRVKNQKTSFYFDICRMDLLSQKNTITIRQSGDIRKEALKDIRPYIRFTGNRQNVPSASAFRTIKSESNPLKDHNLLEKMHVTIMEVNQAEKDDYVKKNGMDSLNKRKLLGYIQDPVQTEPLSIVFYNKASLKYYHLYASRNPGIFIDYTGQLIKPVPPYLCAKYQDNQNDYKKILNALITMPSGSGPNAPPIDILELVANDLTASNL
ncbi:22098_t:CDS:2 [Entrophospora sp. SA101]|nr:22098_t:CDS:2 [Entrophospora sp. SA101]